MKKGLTILLLLVALAFSGWGVVRFYPFLFARKVDGEITGIERANPETLVMGGPKEIPAEQMFSYAVAIRDGKSSEIVTASSEDRQWAVAKKGQCAEAKFFPYAPWNLEKSGTYYGARLLRLYDCPVK